MVTKNLDTPFCHTLGKERSKFRRCSGWKLSVTSRLIGKSILRRTSEQALTDDYPLGYGSVLVASTDATYWAFQRLSTACSDGTEKPLFATPICLTYQSLKPRGNLSKL